MNNQIIAAPAVELLKTKPTFSVLVEPVTTNERIIQAWKNFQELKIRLLDDSDFVEIKSERYAKKSAFRKLALAFGLSTEIIKEERRELKNGFAYDMTVKAISPSGRYMIACASCQSNERRFNKESDVRAICETRCTNRSIANLIGWSAPSAEEMLSEAPEEATEVNKEWLNNIFSDEGNKPARKVETDEAPITSRQRDLLISLLNQKITDESEREEKISMVDNLSRREASENISELISFK